ncbi:hypothetical protein Dda_6580 [Drechslerella dactyloides]|uniref:Uncharacterized protein n=1 Tax=Drechslerella dactyloides TaxID=74499 RepID=A0AAD6NGB7_DREDA|nr:hypothetical protein Dda_6580 [Drechslerella dactyloides]
MCVSFSTTRRQQDEAASRSFPGFETRKRRAAGRHTEAKWRRRPARDETGQVDEGGAKRKASARCGFGLPEPEQGSGRTSTRRQARTLSAEHRAIRRGEGREEGKKEWIGEFTYKEHQRASRMTSITTLTRLRLVMARSGKTMREAEDCQAGPRRFYRHVSEQAPSTGQEKAP